MKFPIFSGNASPLNDYRIPGTDPIFTLDMKSYKRFFICDKAFPLRYAFPSTDAEFVDSMLKRILETRVEAEQTDMKRQASVRAELEAEVSKKGPHHVHHRNGDKRTIEILNAAAHHRLHPPPPRQPRAKANPLQAPPDLVTKRAKDTARKRDCRARRAEFDAEVNEAPFFVYRLVGTCDVIEGRLEVKPPTIWRLENHKKKSIDTNQCQKESLWINIDCVVEVQARLEANIRQAGNLPDPTEVWEATKRETKAGQKDQRKKTPRGPRN